MSQCPSCGYAPFRQDSTAYCEAVSVDQYYPAEFPNNRPVFQIPWYSPPTTITTTITLYINFNSYLFSYNTNATIIARLQVPSIHTSVLTNNMPEVTLTHPNGTEGSSLELTLKNTTAGIEYCYDELRDTNHTLYHVQANIHSPGMYTHTRKHYFYIRLTFYSPESVQLTNILRYRRVTHTITVDITRAGMFSKYLNSIYCLLLFIIETMQGSNVKVQNEIFKPIPGIGNR